MALSSVRLLWFVRWWQAETQRIRNLDWWLVSYILLSPQEEPTLFDRYGLDAKGLGQTHLNLSINLIGGPYQSGALFSYEGHPDEVIIRVGVSFVSADQACSNAESEVGTSSFEDIVSKSKALWQEKLSKIEIDVPNTLPNITEMLYTSLYRSSLTPVSGVGSLRLVSCSHRITEQRDGWDTRGIREYNFILLWFFVLQVSLTQTCSRDPLTKLFVVFSWDTVKQCYWSVLPIRWLITPIVSDVLPFDESSLPGRIFSDRR